MKPKLTDAEREIIFENLIHDLAGLDTTTEEEAGKLYDRLVAEGRIDPAATAEAHRRLLVRLGMKPGLESPRHLRPESYCAPTKPTGAYRVRKSLVSWE